MNVFSIFKSISGEVGALPQGSPSVFVRFNGCNLCCNWCDTRYALIAKGPSFEKTPQQIVDEVQRISKGVNHVLLTGGEPLMCNRDDLQQLINLLRDNGYLVSIETNGTYPCDYENVNCYIVDYKLFSSGEIHNMMTLSQFANLPAGSFLKFVITDRIDYQNMKEIIGNLKQMGANLTYWASPGCMGRESIQSSFDYLYKMLMSDGFPPDINVNVQIHKLISAGMEPA